MHAQDFQEPKGDIIWTKTPSKSRRHTKVWHEKDCPNYIKEPNQHMIDHKVQQVN